MPPLALSDSQIAELQTIAAGVPRRLRAAFLQYVADALRGRPFDDGDVWRVGHDARRAAVQETSADMVLDGRGR